ncbi:MAG: serine hydrolase domain-containing protein [Pyrinomonadaceae bacterium]
MKFCFKTFGFLFTAVVLFAAVSVSADDVDKYVEAKMAETHVPGVAIAVVKNGKVVKTKGYGVASVEFGVPVTTKTVFEIGSVSKQITAAAIMLLVEDKKIDLDDKISKYLKDTPDSWKDVTVRNLLTHTSGIRSYTSIGGFELSKRYKVKDFIAELSKQPLDFETGSAYKYSNSGYSLLGYIIESASGKTYWEFLRERIYRPLGMDLTADRDPKFVIKNRAVGYEWENGHLVGRDYQLTDLFSAGAIVSTVDDLAKWVIALRDESILTNSSKTESYLPFKLTNGEISNYGLGWNIVDFRGQHILRHGGQTAGFAANVSQYVDKDISIVVLTNLGTQGLGSAIAQGIAKFYIPELSLRSLPVTKDADHTIRATVVEALTHLTDKKPESKIFTDEMIVSLSSERMQGVLKRIAKYGRQKNIQLVEFSREDNKWVYRYLAETPDRLFLWRISVSEEGRISELTLEEEE